jgi:hypothetical protein
VSGTPLRFFGAQSDTQLQWERLHIDHVLDSKIMSVPPTKITVKVTTAVLVQHLTQLPGLQRKWPTITMSWKRIFKSIWYPMRNHKKSTTYSLNLPQSELFRWARTDGGPMT